MRKLWLVFAQAATVALGVLFVVVTLKPDWLGRPALGPHVVEFTQALPAGSAATRTASYSEAVRRATPAVVNIFTSKEIKNPQHPFLNDPLFRHFFGDRLEADAQRASSLGSGVIVSPRGYILTNQHVVEAADEIEVALLDGKKLKARLVGSDPETDLAVLQVNNGSLPSIAFGDAESLRVGDVVLAIGNPFGVGQTVTMGIVSALGRNQLGINTFENFIQTDAAINPGNSGGALIDTAGNLIGINTAIYSRSGGSLGIGFAIPSSSARQVMEQIVATGVVTRGWIGVEAQELASDVSVSDTTDSGVLIAGVLRGGPAERAGARPGEGEVAHPAVGEGLEVRQLLVLGAGQQEMSALDAEQHRGDALVGVLAHLVRVAGHLQRAPAAEGDPLQELDLAQGRGEEAGQVHRLRVHRDGEDLRVDAALLQPRQVHLADVVAGEQIVALVEHRLGDVAVRVHHHRVQVELPVLRAHFGGPGGGAGGAEQGEGGVSHGAALYLSSAGFCSILAP